MPKLSDTMEEGTVLSWMKNDGDAVKKGDPIAEIETDKASFEIEADADGVLQIVVDQGKAVPVGEVIGRIGKEGEKPAASPKPEPEGGDGQAAETSGGAGKAEATTSPPAEGAVESDDEAEAASRAQAQDEPEERAEAPTAEATHTQEGKPPSEDRRIPEEAEPKLERQEADADGEGAAAQGVKASPIARRLAKERGIDLAGLKGSGPEGRIVKEDVLAAGPAGGRQQSAQQRPQSREPGPRSGPEVEVEELTRMQATVARRMTLSKTSVPHFYVTVEARMDEAAKIRSQLKETVPNAEKVSVTDMLVRACALALRKYPEVNASWGDGHIERKRSINIGIAVAQPKGLIVPVVHDADRKDLVSISIESRQLIERARAGKASEQDLKGGTFSISNLGMFGVDEFQAIINPPESAILAVGGIRESAVVVDGHLTVGKLMRMTISVDHRVFYGATAAEFMSEVRRLIENPVSLVMPPVEE
jgi:pyruvate dehydrogenase E2 component (dihydrolipoamide acetyltransferase)